MNHYLVEAETSKRSQSAATRAGYSRDAKFSYVSGGALIRMLSFYLTWILWNWKGGAE